MTELEQMKEEYAWRKAVVDDLKDLNQQIVNLKVVIASFAASVLVATMILAFKASL